MEYILSVGTNIGDRKENIERCIESVNLLPGTEVVKTSALYETEPVGYADQQNFYNILLMVESKLEPNEMLGACLGIEAGFSGHRVIRFGPRIIDVDIIFAEDKVIETENLTVPHPRYGERRFVLQPLLDLFENGEVYGIDIKPMLEKISDQEIEKISF